MDSNNKMGGREKEGALAGKGARIGSKGIGMMPSSKQVSKQAKQVTTTTTTLTTTITKTGEPTNQRMQSARKEIH